MSGSLRSTRNAFTTCRRRLVPPGVLVLTEWSTPLNIGVHGPTVVAPKLEPTAQSNTNESAHTLPGNLFITGTAFFVFSHRCIYNRTRELDLSCTRHYNRHNKLGRGQHGHRKTRPRFLRQNKTARS